MSASSRSNDQIAAQFRANQFINEVRNNERPVTDPRVVLFFNNAIGFDRLSQTQVETYQELGGIVPDEITFVPAASDAANEDKTRLDLQYAVSLRDVYDDKQRAIFLASLPPERQKNVKWWLSKPALISETVAANENATLSSLQYAAWLKNKTDDHMHMILAGLTNKTDDQIDLILVMFKNQTDYQMHMILASLTPQRQQNVEWWLNNPAQLWETVAANDEATTRLQVLRTVRQEVSGNNSQGKDNKSMFMLLCKTLNS